MRLSLEECFKFVQVVLLYKLDIIYLEPVSNEVSDPSVEMIWSVDKYLKCRYKHFFITGWEN